MSSYLTLFSMPFRRDKHDYRDIFVRDASLVGNTRVKRLILNDVCKFDIVRSKLFYTNFGAKNDTLLFFSYKRRRSY